MVEDTNESYDCKAIFGFVFYFTVLDTGIFTAFKPSPYKVFVFKSNLPVQLNVTRK